MAASVITRDLEECHLRTRHLVQYLATHHSEGFFYRYGEEGEQMDIQGDASFAPGGSASRTGWILCLGSHALTWGSQRQTLIALSTCEAELIAAISAILAAQPMLLLLEEIRRQVREELSLRNRHLSIRAECLRDLPENVSTSYTSTGEQKADKGLARGLHQKAIRDIGMKDSAVAVEVGAIERKESRETCESNSDVSTLAIAIEDGQQERVQRSMEQIEDAMRQCCDPFPSIVPTYFGRGFGQTVLSDKLLSESSSGRTSLESSSGRTFGTVLSDELFLGSSLGRTFGTVLSGQVFSSSGSVAERARALHADTTEDYHIMIVIVSAQFPTLCGHSPVTHTDSESDGDSSNSVFYTRTSSSENTTSSPLGPSSSLLATSSPLGPSSSLFGSSTMTSPRMAPQVATEADLMQMRQLRL